MRIYFGILLAVTCLAGSLTGYAGERVRSEFFPQRHLALQGRWAHARLTGDVNADNRIVGEFSEVELRLFIPTKFTSPPHRVQIFLIIASQFAGLEGGGGLERSWITRGRLLNGKARPGDRVLIFEGVVDAPVLSDFLSATFQIDARKMVGALRFDPAFEIEQR